LHTQALQPPTMPFFFCHPLAWHRVVFEARAKMRTSSLQSLFFLSSDKEAQARRRASTLTLQPFSKVFADLRGEVLRSSCQPNLV
jgi:hypothetical protein